MGIEENKVIMQRYFDELMNNRDYSKVDEIPHEDYAASEGHGLKGIKGHKQYIDYLHSGSSNGHVETQELVAEGNKVVAFSKWIGTWDKEFIGIPPNGKQFSYDMIGMYEFKDGKVYRGLVRSLGDKLGQYQQLGFLPSTEEIIQAYKDSLK